MAIDAFRAILDLNAAEGSICVQLAAVNKHAQLVIRAGLILVGFFLYISTNKK